MENRLQPLYRYRWSKSGVFNIIFKMLLSSLHAHGLVDWSATALDGRNIRALRCAVGAQKNPDISGVTGMGRSSGGFSTKIHLATDGSGLPFNIVLSPGQAHERQFALRLLDGIGVQRQNGSMKRRGHTALANKAYSRHALRNELKNKGYKNSHSRKSNENMASDGRSQLDRKEYRNRNVTKRSVGRLKEYHRIATCYDKRRGIIWRW